MITGHGTREVFPYGVRIESDHTLARLAVGDNYREIVNYAASLAEIHLPGNKILVYSRASYGDASHAVTLVEFDGVFKEPS